MSVYHTRYFTVVAMSSEGLDEEVQKKLKEGWSLYGNPYFFPNGMAGYFCQAMTK